MATKNFLVLLSLVVARGESSQVSTKSENDLEGLLAFVRKDGSVFGKLEGIVTVFHDDFYAYTPTGSPLTKGSVTIDGALSFKNVNRVPHPMTVQEAKGHGIKAWPYAGNFHGRRNEDGIIYIPAKAVSEIPTSGNDRQVFL